MISTPKNKGRFLIMNALLGSLILPRNLMLLVFTEGTGGELMSDMVYAKFDIHLMLNGRKERQLLEQMLEFCSFLLVDWIIIVVVQYSQLLTLFFFLSKHNGQRYHVILLLFQSNYQVSLNANYSFYYKEYVKNVL